MILPLMFIVDVSNPIQDHYTILWLVTLNVLEDLIASLVDFKSVVVLVKELVDSTDVVKGYSHVVVVVALLLLEVGLLGCEVLLVLWDGLQLRGRDGEKHVDWGWRNWALGVDSRRVDVGLGALLLLVMLFHSWLNLLCLMLLHLFRLILLAQLLNLIQLLPLLFMLFNNSLLHRQTLLMIPQRLLVCLLGPNPNMQPRQLIQHLSTLLALLSLILYHYLIILLWQLDSLLELVLFSVQLNDSVKVYSVFLRLLAVDFLLNLDALLVVL